MIIFWLFAKKTLILHRFSEAAARKEIAEYASLRLITIKKRFRQWI